MTRTTNARIAGLTFLIYIVATIGGVIIFSHAAGGGGTAAKLSAISAHPTDMHIVTLLGVVQGFAALVLAVTLYALTRDQDRDLAMLAMVCRLTEGVIGGVAASANLALFWVATASGPDAPSADAARALGGYLLRDNSAVPALFFAAGSALFAYLLLRGRAIPRFLSWLGLSASILLIMGLPAQIADLLAPLWASVMWLPMLAFEITLGLWLLIKGIDSTRQIELGNANIVSGHA